MTRPTRPVEKVFARLENFSSRRSELVDNYARPFSPPLLSEASPTELSISTMTDFHRRRNVGDSLFAPERSRKSATRTRFSLGRTTVSRVAKDKLPAVERIGTIIHDETIGKRCTVYTVDFLLRLRANIVRLGSEHLT